MDFEEDKRKDKNDLIRGIRTIALKEVIPISGFPAALIPSLDSTVICDLHIGYEEELVEQGIILPKTQLERLINTIEEITKIVKTKRLIINGDLRHGFKKINKRQRKEIERFLLHISSYFKEAMIIKGNHDNYIKPIAKEYGIAFLDSLFEKEIFITHGHKENQTLTKKSKIIVIGHEHPAIILRDSYGNQAKFLSFIYFPTKLKNYLILLPPFSSFAGGNLISRENLLSDYTKKYAILGEGIPFVIYPGIGTIELPKLSLIGYSY